MREALEMEENGRGGDVCEGGVGRFPSTPQGVSHHLFGVGRSSKAGEGKQSEGKEGKGNREGKRGG